MNESRKIDRSFLLLFIGLYGSQMIYGGFWPSFVRNFGYNDTFMGVCTSISTISGMILGLLLSYIMDKLNKPRLIILMLFANYTIMLALVFALNAPAWLLYIFYAFCSSTMFSTVNFSNVWIFKLQTKYPDLSFSRMRSYGSISYAISGIFVGSILSRFGDKASVVIMGLALLLVVPAVFSIPNPPDKDVRKEDDDEKQPLLPQVKKVFKNKLFIMLSICDMLDNMTTMATPAMYSVIMKDLNANAFQTGLGFFVQSFTEFLIIRNYKKLSEKFTVRKLYLFGVFFSSIRAIALSLAGSAWAGVFLIAINGMSYGITLTSMSLMKNDVLDYHIKSFAATVMGMIFSVIRIFSAPVQGMISDTYGIPVMLRVFSCFAIIEFIILVINYKNIPDSNDYT